GDTASVRQLLVQGAGVTAKGRNEALLAAAGFAVMTLEVPTVEPADRAGDSAHKSAPMPAMDPSQAARLLSANGASIEPRHEDGSTPLILAASFGLTRVVQALLEAGAAVEATDTRGNTALISAACVCAQASMNDTLDAVKLLLEKKASVNVR